MKFAVALVVLLGLGLCAAYPTLSNAPADKGGKVFGDILLTPEQEAFYFGKSRTGLIDPTTRWPNNNVPFIYTEQNSTERAVIESSIRLMEDVLCLKFVERTTEVDYIYITSYDSGCWSWVGRLGGPQQLNLGDGCYWEVVVIHEFIHALGFFHMQSAEDRDNYVRVLWENIIPGMEHNFDMVTPNTTSQFDEPYDYYSIMHYPYWAFAIDESLPTMEALQPNVTLDYRWYMTETDTRRINNMYC